MIKKVGVAILGLGVVGGGTYQTLVEHHDFYVQTQQVDISVEAVLDRNLDRLKSLGIEDDIIAGSIEEVIANPNVDFTSLNGQRPDFTKPNTTDGLTEKGIEAQKCVEKIFLGIDEISFKGFTEEEKIQAINYFNRINENLTEGEKEID